MITAEILPNTRNLIFYKNAFLKIDFITKIIESANIPVVYFDFDLLFSGYCESGYFKELTNIEFIRPNSKNLKDILPNIIAKISSQKIILILDSLNGFHSFLDDDNPARFANSLIMLLSANQKFSQSTLIITCSAQKKEGTWVLPTGRHILEFENMNKFFITENDKKTVIESI